MVEPVMVKPSVEEISPMVSFEDGAVVFEVYAIPVVTVPYRIIVIDVSGEIGFTDGRIGIIAAVIDGSRLIDNGRGYRRGCNKDPGMGYAEAKVSAYIYLGVAPGSDEAGGYNGGDHK